MPEPNRRSSRLAHNRKRRIDEEEGTHDNDGETTTSTPDAALYAHRPKPGAGPYQNDCGILPSE
jgi:hypothetical protein